MKKKHLIVCGFLAVLFVWAFGACSKGRGSDNSSTVKEERLTGTDSFTFTLIKGGTEYIVSKGTATVGAVNIPAYYRPDSKSDYLPVTEIDKDAFRDCENITSITIPSTVKSIGKNSFSGCEYLTGSVTIPEGVTEIGGNAFYGCARLTSITILAGVTSIGDYAFCYCTSLTSITILAGVTYIGDYAFFRCTSLTSIAIPAGVTYIGDWAFYNCTSLTSIAIPAGVTYIGKEAFAYCTGLISITIPASVQNIGDSAFAGWTSSQTIDIPFTNASEVEAAWGRRWGWLGDCYAVLFFDGKRIW